MNSAGSLLLITPHRDLAPPPREFNLTFDLLVGFAEGEAEADGRLTVCLYPNPSPSPGPSPDRNRNRNPNANPNPNPALQP